MKEHQKNYISYASVAVIKYPDRTNLRRLGFFFQFVVPEGQTGTVGSEDIDTGTGSREITFLLAQREGTGNR